MGSTPDALSSARQALKNADNFGQRETGNKKAGDDAPKPAKTAAASSDYSHARAARSGGEFMGVRSNEASELNTALAAREDAKKALE
jgi:hypothetical protein